MASILASVRTRPTVLAVAFLGVLAAQFLLFHPGTEQGAPYAEWDEIATFNQSYVLTGPASLRTYRYGSLETGLQVVARAWHQWVDPIGRETVRLSYTNSYPETFVDPDAIHRTTAWPGVDYSYFRGSNDREPIFLSRKIHLVVVYAVLGVIGVAAVAGLGWSAAPFLLALLCVSVSRDFSVQALLSLPNAINTTLAAGILLSLALFHLRSDDRLFSVAVVLSAISMNFKIDAVFLVVPFVVSLSFVLAARGVGPTARVCGMAAAWFAAAYVATKPFLLVQPLRELKNQFGLFVTGQSGSTALSSKLDALGRSFDANLVDVLAPALGGPGALAAVVGVCLVAAVAIGSVCGDRTAPCLPVVALLLAGLAVLLAGPLAGAAQVYDRYFMTAWAVGFVVVGVFAVLPFAPRRLVGEVSRPHLARGGAAALAAFLAIYYGAGASATYARIAASGAPFTATGGLDPAHDRNRAALKMVELIERDGYAAEVLVDQHGYTDLRYFREQGLSPRYVHMTNLQETITACEGTETRLLLHTPGRTDQSNARETGWEPRFDARYETFRQTLDRLPVVFAIAGREQNLFGWSPVPRKVGVVVHAVPCPAPERLFSERLGPRPEVDLVGPGGPVLVDQAHVRLGDGGGVEGGLGVGVEAFPGARRQDDAVDHHVGHVDALGPILPGQGLGQGAQGELGRSEGAEVPAATQGRGGAGEQDGAGPGGRHGRHHGPGAMDGAQAGDPPQGLELPGRGLGEGLHQEPRRVVDEHRRCAQLGADGVHGAHHRLGVGNVAGVGAEPAALGGEFARQALAEVRGPGQPGDGEAAADEGAAQGAAQTRADARHHRDFGALCHRSVRSHNTRATISHGRRGAVSQPPLVGYALARGGADVT